LIIQREFTRTPKMSQQFPYTNSLLLACSFVLLEFPFVKDSNSTSVFFRSTALLHV